MRLILSLYFEFFKAGLFAIGGGMATFPFLQDIGERTGWFTNSQLIDMIAVSESTPGPIGINCATYAGNQAFGILGGIVATLGLITPSLIIIMLISKVLNSFRDNLTVQKIFYGLRPASTAMIAASGVSIVLVTFINVSTLTKTPLSSVNWFGIVLATVLYYAIKKWKKHPIFYIALSAVAGIVAGYLNLL